MIYLTLVIFFGFLLVVWFVVSLLFRLNRNDSIESDTYHLWGQYKKTREDMRYPKKK
jgi:hypothetical protein